MFGGNKSKQQTAKPKVKLKGSSTSGNAPPTAKVDNPEFRNITAAAGDLGNHSQAYKDTTVRDNTNTEKNNVGKDKEHEINRPTTSKRICTNPPDRNEEMETELAENSQQSDILVPLILKGLNKPLESICPTLLGNYIRSRCGKIDGKFLNRGDFMLFPKSFEQHNAIIDMKKILGVDIGISEAASAVSIKGIVRNIHRDLTLELLEEYWEENNIISIKFLDSKKYKDSTEMEKLALTRTAEITFRGTILPKELKIEYQVFKVSEKAPVPIRCFKCQRYGHVANVCRGQMKCANCGEAHDSRECKTTIDNPICVNCKGQHVTWHPRCPTRVVASETVKVVLKTGRKYNEVRKEIENSKKVIPGFSYAKAVGGGSFSGNNDINTGLNKGRDGSNNKILTIIVSLLKAIVSLIPEDSLQQNVIVTLIETVESLDES